MGSLLITNGRLATLDQTGRFIDSGSIYVEDGLITAVGASADVDRAADLVIDACGNLVMPALINTHHHLYSTFARGFTPPGAPARNFPEILSRLWWKLDAALTSEDVYYSALLALMECARAGCTTIIDHHASPGCTDGSLDQVERAFRETGLSGCLSYEVSDRNHEGEGIDENVRWISKCLESDDDQMSGLFGLHALMTLGSTTLERCAAEAETLGAGFHVHAAEDETDTRLTRERHGQGVMTRFREYGMTGPKTIFVHGSNLDEDDMMLLRETGSIIVNNPESNMNNGLKVAPTLEFLRHGIKVGLGTDGMSSHMISQARAMYLHHRSLHNDPTLAFAEACEILLGSNRDIANTLFAQPRGQLAPGWLADIVIYDYLPFTPLNADTLFGHLLFGIGFAAVRTTIARGKVVLDRGHFPHLDEVAIHAHCRERAAALWQRIH